MPKMSGRRARSAGLVGKISRENRHIKRFTDFSGIAPGSRLPLIWAKFRQIGCVSLYIKIMYR